jgi:hypothetical protein
MTNGCQKLEDLVVVGAIEGIYQLTASITWHC